MKNSVMVAVSSVLLILLLTFHLADDVVRGYEAGGLSILTVVPVVALWLWAALVLAGRRSGYITSGILSLLSVGIPIIHMKGKGVGLSPRVAHTVGGFFFVWTLLAIALIGLFAFALSVRGVVETSRRSTQVSR